MCEQCEHDESAMQNKKAFQPASNKAAVIKKLLASMEGNAALPEGEAARLKRSLL